MIEKTLPEISAFLPKSSKSNSRGTSKEHLGRVNMNKGNTSLRSRKWRDQDIRFVTKRFTDIGFEKTEEIMDLRVFDLLNMNRVDAETAREMILALYRFYNPNTMVDEAMEQQLMDQYFPFAEWRKKHRNLSVITVRELVMAEDINRKAILHFYNSIQRAFYKSKEYSSREYRYLDYWDLLQDRRK